MRRNRKTILNAIKTCLNTQLGDKLKYVILFGSRAWGKAKTYSDYDLLIVLAQNYDWRMREKISEILYEIDLNYDICTQPLVISEDEINNSLRGTQPIIQKALQKGIYV